MELTFSTLRQLADNKTINDVPCPVCLDQCRTPEGRKRKCLRVYHEHDDFIRYTCARCGTSGYAKPDDGSVTTAAPKIERTPVEKTDKSALCNFLWDKSQPAIGSLAEVYMRTRACWPDHPCPSIRFLPARDHKGTRYEPAMISRFGFAGEPVTGVHLTKLLLDGSGKAAVDPAKITMGDTSGQPIVIHNNEERGEIVIAEGIEDTSSLVLATNWTGWAAGTAGRIPAVVAAAVAKGFESIYVAKDVDTINQHARGRSIEPGASRNAIEQAKALTPIIPLSFGGIVVGYGEHLDANLALRRYGKEWLAAAIEWCDLQHKMARNLLTFHQMDRMRTPLKRILFRGP